MAKRIGALSLLACMTIYPSCHPPISQNASNQWPPILQAAASGNQQVVQDLIHHGANINQTSKAGKTALILAAQSGEYGIVRILIHAGADISLAEATGETALIHAAGWGYEDVVHILLQSKPKKNDITRALIAAAANGQISVVKRMLEKGASPTARNKYGITPAIVAAINGQQPVLKMLERYHAESLR